MVKSENSSTPKTVGDILDEFREAMCMASIYQEIVDHLSQFIKTDTAQPLTGIRMISGPPEPVPENYIRDVRNYLISVVDKHKGTIEDIRCRPIEGAPSEKKPEKPKPKQKDTLAKKTETKGKKVKRRPRVVARNTTSNK